MPTTTSEDTEITLGTGKLLSLFFALVALCAVFFSMGFSLGKSYMLKPAPEVATLPPSTVVMRPSAVKTPDAPSTDTATVKPVSDKQPDVSPSAPDASSAATAAVTSSDPAIQPPTSGFYVQVAAVTKPEDAEALVDALKKKSYPAFSVNAPDKFFHVQVGPYPDVKDAEVMRTKLVSDGYNPILKK